MRPSGEIARTGWSVALLVGVLCVVGCPTYEDTYSGTYRQEGLNAVSAKQPIQVDLFRYGGNVSAILRFFEPDVNRDLVYAEQTFCTRTEPSNFNEADRRFTLPIDRGSRIPESRMRGTIPTDGELDVRVSDTNGNEVVANTELARKSRDPDGACESVDVFLVRPQFDLLNEDENRLPTSANYDVEHPVFSVQWVGGQVTDQNLYVPTEWGGPSVRLGSNTFIDDDESAQSYDELRGGLQILVPAPPDEALTDSGETSFVLGHLTVIDDGSSSGEFDWAGMETEPVVASALQRWAPPDKSTGPGGQTIDGSGRALLFVEDRLQDLSDELLEGFFERPSAIRNGEVPESHFYVVDVYYDRKEGVIREIAVPQNLDEHLHNRGVPLKMTDRYLGENVPGLPRLVTGG